MHIANLTAIVVAVAAVLAVFASGKIFSRAATRSEDKFLRDVRTQFLIARRVWKCTRTPIPAPHGAILGTCARFGMRPEFASSLEEMDAIRLTPDMVKRPAEARSRHAAA